LHPKLHDYYRSKSVLDMAEFLATGSAIVTIVAAALHSARLLHDDFKKIKSAHENIKPVVDDLDSVVGILSSLETAARDPTVPKETLDMIGSGDVKAATENCNKVCKGFRDKLGRWMKHSTDGRLDLRDRFRIFLGEKDVLEFRAQLLACKGTFTITLQMEAM
jgi:predicted nicotinamide N-methyase